MFGFLCCAALLGYAFYVQFQLADTAVPFCIFQRIAFAGLGLVFLVGGLASPSKARCAQGLGLLALARRSPASAYAGRHSWVQLFPPEMPNCGPGLNFMLERQSWLGVARKVLMADGDCSNINWQFLGLSMPMWCLLWFIALAAWRCSPASVVAEPFRFAVVAAGTTARMMRCIAT